MFKLTQMAVAACALAATAMPAIAADIISYQPVPVPAAVLGGWYLRGDIGYSNQHVDELFNVLYDEYDDVHNIHKEFTGAPFAAAGVGYRFNHWFRVDATGEYRSKSEFNGADIAEIDGISTPNVYTAKKSEWVALVNAYVDLGSWHGISPFIGAGIGAANIEIDAFTDTGVANASVAFGDEHDEWNFAWAVHAGVGVDVTENFTVELAYCYLHLGDAESGNLVAFDGTDLFDNPMKFEDVASHDVKLGVRYQFN